MFLLIQIIRNLVLRLFAWLSQWLGQIWRFLVKLFGWFQQSFGLKQTAYFLSDEEAKTLQPPSQESKRATERSTDVPSQKARRPDGQLEKYRKLARELKSS